MENQEDLELLRIMHFSQMGFSISTKPASKASISISICDEMISRFFDSKSGGFFLVEEGAKDLIARPKEAYDGATPSGNSVASLVLLKLAELTGREDFKLKAKSVFVAFSSRIR